jgi:hypothetical protein
MEYNMAKVKAVFYLPVHDKDGRSLNREIADVEMELYLHFVGWTFQGYVKGAYQMADGTRSMDNNASYSVGLDESRVDELEQVLREFKSKTLQEAIYLEIHRHVDVRFIT